MGIYLHCSREFADRSLYTRCVHVKGDFSSAAGSRCEVRVGDVPDPGEPMPFTIPMPSTTLLSSSHTRRYCKGMQNLMAILWSSPRIINSRDKWIDLY